MWSVWHIIVSTFRLWTLIILLSHNFIWDIFIIVHSIPNVTWYCHSPIADSSKGIYLICIKFPEPILVLNKIMLELMNKWLVNSWRWPMLAWVDNMVLHFLCVCVYVCICVCVCVCLCVYICVWVCMGGGGGALYQWDSESSCHFLLAFFFPLLPEKPSCWPD